MYPKKDSTSFQFLGMSHWATQCMFSGVTDTPSSLTILPKNCFSSLNIQHFVFNFKLCFLSLVRTALRLRRWNEFPSTMTSSRYVKHSFQFNPCKQTGSFVGVWLDCNMCQKAFARTQTNRILLWMPVYDDHVGPLLYGFSPGLYLMCLRRHFNLKYLCILQYLEEEKHLLW